ncbi:hypothetical protein [Sanguibacter antarcticus]|uniref:Uncharacterized protein n=1 Tax=Sanguibacter antarcticus TaxID=372484 RepID=A0A2A9E4P5_9MICO|nr:hypothetical protein [Sanguibacter antarcticus]PFG33160.1 hypothetical protein ATL42_1020 [Sanguibacter antarcticus]
MRRLLTYTAIELVTLTLLQHELNLDPTHLAMLTLSTLALTITATPTHAPTTHPRWPRTSRDRRPGSRDDVASLAWTFFGRDGTITAQALRTTRTIAATRLHAHGANLYDPDDTTTCRTLLGPHAHHHLDPTTPTTTPRPSVTELARIITTLENLTPPTDTHPHTRTTTT